MEAMRQRQVNGQKQSVSLAIDTTKFSQVIDISTASRAIIVGVYHNHMLSTSDMTRTEIKDFIDKK